MPPKFFLRAVVFLNILGRLNGITTSTPRARRRITRVNDTSAPSGDINMEAAPAPASECRIGDPYPPSRLLSIRGDYWALDRAVLVQRDHKDVDGSLIAPHELNDKLVEGTLVLVQLKLVTYIMTDQKMEKGDPMPDKKASRSADFIFPSYFLTPPPQIYHIWVDRLRILGHGDGEPWYPPVPTIPERRYRFLSTCPQKRPRDESADAAFDNFGANSPSPSPARRRRH
ncbi:hypothetical protein B0H13DRAFT_1875827 [Mycena leptocephala]|nr:hypothetical protein B0H13DRAFT_1875827 [Mycena leptocephala]